MYHVQYLSSLCQRRRWPDPLYQSFQTTAGYVCVVRVNNREYQTDMGYDSELLAREHAAMCAYYICRDFSVNDGMYPAGAHPRRAGGVIQGLPVAIGAGRRTTTAGLGAPAYPLDVDAASESGSSGSSPNSSDDGRARGGNAAPVASPKNRRHEKKATRSRYF